MNFKDFTIEKPAPIVHGTAMFYRSLALEVGNYRPWFVVGEDFDLWLRIMEKKTAVILNKCLYNLRIHWNSATNRYKDILSFYRQKLIEFSQIRRNGQLDPLPKGEFPPQQQAQKLENLELPKPDGTIVRDDLNFMHTFALDAKDFKLWKKITKEILKYGWKRKQTYKILIFLLLGNLIVNLGVNIKSYLGNKPEKKR